MKFRVTKEVEIESPRKSWYGVFDKNWELLAIFDSYSDAEVYSRKFVEAFISTVIFP